MMIFCFLYTAHSKDCPHPCVVNGHHFCEPPPCPPPACQDPVYAPGQCCTVCPKDCPHGTCKIGNRTMCYPIPCPLPPCQKPVITPGDCCPHCPKGTTIFMYIKTFLAIGLVLQCLIILLIIQNRLIYVFTGKNQNTCKL